VCALETVCAWGGGGGAERGEGGGCDFVCVRTCVRSKERWRDCVCEWVCGFSMSVCMYLFNMGVCMYVFV